MQRFERLAHRHPWVAALLLAPVGSGVSALAALAGGAHVTAQLAVYSFFAALAMLGAAFRLRSRL